MDPAVYYWDYLGLDALLGSQRLESAAAGRPAHDEMLFVIVHQAYELWFKQILWELDAVIAVMGRDAVAEEDLGRVVAHLERIATIQRVLQQHLDVMETMTPLDFLEFRDLLAPASGFQSVQFRLIENRLGLRRDTRLKINAQPYTAVLAPEHVALLEDAEAEPSLRDHLESWLERTPFLHWGEYDFWRSYGAAVRRMLDAEQERIDAQPEPDRAEQQAQHDATEATFATLFDRDRYEVMVAEHRRHLSHQAFLAALLITLYRDEPVLHMPFRLLTALISIDEGFTAWRQRHALMAHRMIGSRIGTGGTSGHRYLQAAADRHRVFADLFDLSAFSVPRSQLPPLPAEVRAQMQFALRRSLSSSERPRAAGGS